MPWTPWRAAFAGASSMFQLHHLQLARVVVRGEAQVSELSVHGERRPTRTEEILFREGVERHDFFAVLAGKVAIVAGYGSDDERLFAVHGPGRFLGELSLVRGQEAPTRRGRPASSSLAAVRVHLLVRGGDLGESMSRYLVDQIERNPLVEVMLNTEVRELAGSDGALGVAPGATPSPESTRPSTGSAPLRDLTRARALPPVDESARNWRKGTP